MTDWTPDIRERLAPLSLRPEREAEIIEELSQHLDDQIRERVAGGMAPDVARREVIADLDASGKQGKDSGPLRSYELATKLVPRSDPSITERSQQRPSP